MIVLTDKDIPPNFPKRIGATPIEVWSLGAFTKAGGQRLIVEADLGKARSLKEIYKLLRHGPRPLEAVFVIDLTNHHARTQANALGATEMVQGPLTQECLFEILADRSFSSRADRKAQASILKTADALDSAFAAIRNRGELDVDGVRRSSDEIVSAIADEGLSEWLDAVRAAHESTFQHCLLVTGIVTAFGHRVGMSHDDISTLTLAGIVHDIGKMHLPLALLDKPTALTKREAVAFRRHARLGHDYLAAKGQVPQPILDVVLHHHEYLDGSGYPDKLQGDEIGNLTRVMTVCDVYAALIEKRNYKESMSPPEALGVLFGMAEKGKVEYAFVVVLAEMLGLRTKARLEGVA